MKRTKITVLTKLDNVEENSDFLAIKDNNLIKYIDLENNKMIIDMENDIIIRENRDYLFNIDFVNNTITILVKKMDKTFTKDIKTLLISKTNNKYLVRYLLKDEMLINEYYVKF